MNESPADAAITDQLIAAIVGKLQANRVVLAKSRNHGRLSWRTSNGKIDVKLEPEL